MKDIFLQVAVFLVIILLVFLLILWIRSKDQMYTITMEPDKEYITSIKYGKEAEPAIEWEIDSDTDKLIVYIMSNDQRIFSTKSKKGEFPLKTGKSNTYIFGIENTGNKNVTINYKVSFKYIGSMGFIPATVTKSKKLEVAR